MPLKKFFAAIFESAAIAGIAVLTMFVVQKYVFNPYVISGTSMSPSFQDGDYVFVDKLSYLAFSEPKRGEVVVFHSPAAGRSEDLVKRIVGLPGERVTVRKGEVTVFNAEHPGGLPLDESYLASSETTAGEIDVELKEGEYFVLGDNRAVSFDSRSWGPLDSQKIVGRVLVRAWPWDSSRVFAAPVY